MKADVYSTDGKKTGSIELPNVFTEEYRPDLIKRAFVASKSASFQPKGINKLSGMRTSATNWGTGAGRARVPRVKAGPKRLGRRAKGHRYRSKGRWFSAAGRASIVPGVVGGREAHPPKPYKNLIQKINNREAQKAVRSALAATTNKEIVSERGHIIDDVKSIPLVVEDKIGTIRKTSEMITALKTLGLEKELERVSVKKTRSGNARRRGRKYVKKVGPLIVITGNAPADMASGNIMGVDVQPLDEISIEFLAPGANAGRLVIWTKSSIEEMKEMFK